MEITRGKKSTALLHLSQLVFPTQAGSARADKTRCRLYLCCAWPLCHKRCLEALALYLGGSFTELNLVPVNRQITHCSVVESQLQSSS